jgi:diaminopimelate decarboxylase/aspartate kinase
MLISNITLKFGGSSMCADGFHTILEQLEKNNHLNIFLVVSAIKNTTNNLFKITNYEKNTYDDIVKDHYTIMDTLQLKSKMLDDTFAQLKDDIVAFTSNHETDFVQHKIKIISYGEILSSIMLYEFLKTKNIKVKFINARTVIKAKNNSTDIDSHNLNIKGAFYCDSKKMLFMMEENINVYLTQGYIASTNNEKYCILSRSGSDTTAALIASAMNSVKLEIWTDVCGMYTADPRFISDAKLIEFIDYDVCQEISACGSYVLHPYCVKPCQEKNVPILVKNTFFPNEQKCTVVGNIKDPNMWEIIPSTDKNQIYAVSIKKGVSVFKVESMDMWEGDGFVSDIFSVFAKYNTGVDIITTSQFSITTTTAEKSKQKIQNVHKQLLEKYDAVLIEKCSVISVTADNVINNQKIHKMMNLINNFGDKNIYIKHYSSNNLTLSIVVDDKIAIDLTKLLHHHLIMQ